MSVRPRPAPTEHVIDAFCPLDTGYVLLREEGPALFVTNPDTSKMRQIVVLPVALGQAILDEWVRKYQPVLQ